MGFRINSSMGGLVCEYDAGYPKLMLSEGYLAENVELLNLCLLNMYLLCIIINIEQHRGF